VAESKQVSLRDLFASDEKEKVSLLSQRRKDIESSRSIDAQEWRMNREFYRGNQYVFPNRYNGRIESLPVDDGDKPRFKVRLVSNQILPGVQHYVAQLMKTRPVINASPDSGSDKDIKSAQLAQSLYEWWWREFHLDAKLQSALVHSAVSQGYWKISWDPLAGKSMRVMLNPETGQPITDDELADMYRDEIKAQGYDPAEAGLEQTVFMGDIRVEAMPGETVLTDPSVNAFEDAAYAICVHSMTPDDIKVRYGVDVEPDAVSGDEATPLAFSMRQDSKPKLTKRVYIGYFKKSPALPKGRYVAWIEEPNKILLDTEWPYPFDELPLIKFPGLERPDSSLDIPVVSPARPIQKELNRSLSQVVEHKNLTIKPQMVAPVGSLRQRLTSEPGAVFEYQPVGGLAPEWRSTPNLPAYVFEHLKDLQHRMDVCFNRMPSQRDQLPARVDGPGGIDLIQEAVSDQISPTIRRMETALAQAGMLMAKLAQKFYIEQRILKIVGAGGSVRVKKFLNTDLEGGFSFHAEAGSGLPRTRAGKQARIEFLLQNQLIDPRQAMKHLDVADMNGVLAAMQADEDQALREHDKMMRGQPLNPAAMREAMAAVNQGINPETHQPIQSPDEVQGIMERAMVQPLGYENGGIHLEQHDLYMKSVEFEGLDPEIQQRFLTHRDLTAHALQSQQPIQDNVKATLQLKGTVGPTGAAEILSQAGVPGITPEIMAEPPLETWVTDSIDKPDTDDAGNDPLTQAEQMMSMQHDAEKHQLTAAKAVHEVALAGAQARDAHSGNQDARAEELHQQKLRQSEEMHQARLKQASKPAPRQNTSK
jgi:hypothetical protein